MTMVRPHAQPPQPPRLAPMEPYSQPSPAPTQGHLLQNGPAFDQRSLAQNPRPMQYAYPLSRHNSYHSQGSDSGRNAAKPPEHMLRRKTPNGILAAAYDGTSVEQMEKPHASKHILLPRTPGSNMPYGMKQDLPLRSPGVNSEYGQPQQNGASDWSPSLYFETGSGRAGGQHALPQIDSMLNQIPPLQPHPQFQQFNNPFAAPPDTPFQSALGPTASNHEGPFGPYWHDGTFIPYRPAAMRDPRYFHHAPNWTHPQHNAFLGHAYANTMPNPAQHHPYQLQHPTTAYGNIARPSFDHQTVYPQPYPNAALDYQNQPIPVPPSQRPHPDYSLSSGQSTPVAEQTPTTPLAEFGPHSINAQTREKVFAWAHSVYVDLLKYLQNTRKASTHQNSNGQPQPARPHIYPKPPKQPAAKISSIPSGATSQQQSQNTQYDSQPSIPTNSHEFFQRPVHHRSSSAWALGAADPNMQRLSWYAAQQQPYNPNANYSQVSSMEPLRPLRRMSGSITGLHQTHRPEVPPSMTAASALDAITKHCEKSEWNWIDGILLGGCLAYALGDYQKAQDWYKHILKLDKDHVEAISNLAATLLALQKKSDAEQYWRRAVKLRPSYFEAVEHLIGLLCSDHRGHEAIRIIEEVERSLKMVKKSDILKNLEVQSDCSASASESTSISEASDKPTFDYETESESIAKDLDELPGSDQPGFGSSGYAIPGCDNGRILALVHAKGNMLYAAGDNGGAAKAFESAVLIGAGLQMQGIGGLIKHILSVVGYNASDRSPGGRRIPPSTDPILLHPDTATKTAHLCFPPHGQLPGLTHVPSEGMARKAAVSTTSNSLLSLAKIFQDGMATNSPKATAFQSNYGVREILALYYLSLALQPSPSTANNVGILLASVQQSAPSRQIGTHPPPRPQIPGLVPGSGITLALAYYNFGLVLDPRHAHLYTNLGSLLKDIGQLDVAIQMYEQAVQCDKNFDIALANLANAVKDKGRISDAILYYKRAVKASPDFAEAVCGLANALNSVCGWNGRGGIADERGARDRWHVDDNGMLHDARSSGARSSGWLHKVVSLVERQLADGEDWGRGMIDERFILDIVRPLALTNCSAQDVKEKQDNMRATLIQWRGHKWEGARVVRLVERAVRSITWQWYQDRYKSRKERPAASYMRPQLPAALTVPAAPTVLPFHTFTCPMSAKQIRLISQRNGLRISCSTLRAPWLPATVYAPPAPPNPYLKIGYVSSDFNNHPLAHLMQSVFGLHDRSRVKAYCYATTASDQSIHRQQIEREAPVFYDASNWPAERLVSQIINDGIHILINLNGYTRGARNEVFAARAAPIQMSFMGFAGTLGAEWCDYLLADDTAVPPDTLRDWRRNVDLEDALVDENSGGTDDQWIYGENIIYCRDTFFCCDHRQSAPDALGRQLTWDEEEHRRWAMRKEIFGNTIVPENAVIFGNFNQLYKIDPTTFRTWLRILERVPNAVLWLLRFPDLGETNLKQTAELWASPDVARRVIFTDVAQKSQHIARARVCDLFLDTPECNAHTTAADVLWSGTPLLTLPRYKYKMCSRMAASILKGALPKSPEGRQAAKELIASSDEEYEDMAVKLASDCVYQGHRATGRLSELRRILYESRWSSALFDTRRWVRDLEEAYEKSWDRWVRGEGGDIWLSRHHQPSERPV